MISFVPSDVETLQMPSESLHLVFEGVGILMDVFWHHASFLRANKLNKMVSQF